MGVHVPYGLLFNSQGWLSAHSREADGWMSFLPLFITHCTILYLLYYLLLFEILRRRSTKASSK
jgi:hypothetical protein